MKHSIQVIISVILFSHAFVTEAAHTSNGDQSDMVFSGRYAGELVALADRELAEVHAAVFDSGTLQSLSPVTQIDWRYRNSSQLVYAYEAMYRARIFDLNAPQPQALYSLLTVDYRPIY